MYFVVDTNYNVKTCATKSQIYNHIGNELLIAFKVLKVDKTTQEEYLESLVDFLFFEDMSPEFTPYFNKLDCYLSDLYSIYEQIM